MAKEIDPPSTWYVYVVIGRHYDQSEVVGVYANEGAAMTHAEKATEHHVGSYDVEEYQLRREPEITGAYF